MITKIWERYFLLESLKTSLFFIFCFYGLYVLVDYASHTGSYHGIKFHWQEVVAYYLYEFSSRLEVLLPFALLLGTTRTLCNLNVHHELVALQSSGISLHRLMLPLIGLGLLGTLILFLNLEFIAPTSMQRLTAIHDSRSEKKVKLNRDIAAQHLVLEDGTTLIFQNYNANQKLFFDVYWVKSSDEILRMNYLALNDKGGATGYNVDHLARDSQQNLIISKTNPEENFFQIRFNQRVIQERMIVADQLPLSELWERLLNASPAASEKEAQVVASFYHKMILPWFCLLAVIGPAPFCLRVTRNLPIFFIYAGGIFGLLCLYLIIDASVLLGKRQVLAPLWAIGLPFSAVVSLLSWRFWKMQ